MSDYLMKCLWKGVADVDQQQDAAERIEGLEAALDGKAQDLTECAVCVYELEAKLAKAEAKIVELEEYKWMYEDLCK